MICYCCGSDAMSALLEHTEPTYAFEAQVVTYNKCRVCQAIRKLPEPDPVSLRAYYERAWQFSEPRPKPCWDSAAVWMAKRIGSSVRNAIDVGGKDLSIFEALHAAGVKIEKKSVLDAQPKAGDVIPAWLGQGFTSQHQYDLVVATHVLEHSTDPRSFLRDIRLMMFGGAWLYLEVPSLELGSYDMTQADDVNPNHLWHFSLQSLTTLLHSSGFLVVQAEADGSVAGWPCNRILAQTRQWEVEAFRDMYDGTRSIYEMATAKITDQYKEGDALYAACNSAWRLHDHDRFLRGTIKSMPIYDLHKTGYFLGRPIRKPDQMKANGVKRIWLTPRFWNSRTEISRWLKENHPNVEVLSPYGAASTVTS